MDDLEKILRGMEEPERRQERVFRVVGSVTNTKVIARDQEKFIHGLVHQTLTMEQLTELAKEFNLRIGDLGPRPINQQKDLFSFGVFRTTDNEGRSISPFTPNSPDWEKSWCGTITAQRI